MENEFQTKKVFLCHAKEDVDNVKKLYEKLKKNGFSPWLDEIDILPGQNWNYEIQKAINSSDFIIICLSEISVDKIGYVNKEIKWALERQDEMPHSSIFLIPVKFDECELPDLLSTFQSVNFFIKGGFDRLLKSLEHQTGKISTKKNKNIAKVPSSGNELLNTLWNSFDEDLQDAISLAYNHSKRKGKNIIKTKYLFSAIKKLKPSVLNVLFTILPEESIQNDIEENISKENILLKESPLFSNCIEESLKKVSKKANPYRKISTRDVFIDISKFGKGGSVSRLRSYGINPDKIDQIVNQLGWEVLKRDIS